MESLGLLWPASGIVAHIIQANRMKTWCGSPIWEEPSTYVMFVPAMIAGPFMFLFLEQDDKPD